MKQIFINVVMIKGQTIGTFKTDKHFSHYGSKRAIVELIFNRYEAESNIDIISENIESIPTLDGNRSA